MAATTTLGLGRPRSLPGYFTLLFSTVVITLQSLALYDPTDAQKQLSISESASARFISFALIAINAYEVIGALQDNWAVYWFSVISRVGAAGLMLILGGGWAGLVPLELGSAVLLGVCMGVSSGSSAAGSSGAKGKKKV